MAADITEHFLKTSASLPMPSAQAINDFFARGTANGSFIAWFNANAAKRGAWKNKSVPSTNVAQDHFKIFWDRASEVLSTTPNLLQFISLMSIFINEVGGDLQPIEEMVGNAQHPGIAYAFDAIPGLKHSYNTLKGNMTAFELFQDTDYRQANAKRAMADRFSDPASVAAAWQHEVWPAGFPTSVDPTQTGFLLEADFYKFRGRGLIQTTGRTNYLKLITFIKGYTGDDPVLAKYAKSWAGMNESAVATTSSNDDWKALFFSGTLTLAREAIKLHEQASGGYFKLDVNDPTVINAEDGRQGSVYRIGKRISGSDTYAQTFKNRVAQICALLEGPGV
jgi:hypothetical protein